MLLFRDRARLEKLVGPRLLAGGVGQSSLGDFQVGASLRQRVAGVPGIYPHQRGPAFHDLTRLDVQLKDLTGRLALHLDGGVGLNGARCLGRHHDVTSLDRDSKVGWRRCFLLAGD